MKDNTFLSITSELLVSNVKNSQSKVVCMKLLLIVKKRVSGYLLTSDDL